jgi:hypothetical protein
LISALFTKPSEMQLVWFITILECFAGVGELLNIEHLFSVKHIENGSKQSQTRVGSPGNMGTRAGRAISERSRSGRDRGFRSAAVS